MSFEPVFDENSQVLILGTWPSPKSWEQGFYYGHPRNRFWPLLAFLTDEPLPQTIEEKKQLLLRHRIALWDVLESCTIQGAQDSTIEDPVPVEIERVLKQAPIRAVLCNGAAAHRLYQQFLLPITGIEAAKLPSTSPANAAWSMQRLQVAWGQELTPFLHDKNN